MKALRCPNVHVLRMIALLAASMLLTQCSMPSRQAWQYIQSNGLLTYWKYEAQHSSPPFRTGMSRGTQRYASSTRGSYAYPRYANRPTSTWSSFWGSGMPNRIPYQPSYYSQNRYYSAAPSRSESRPAPRPRSSDPAPSVTIPVDEPAPQIIKNGPPAPASANPPKSSSPSTTDLPYGTPVPGRVNMVNSPYAGKTQLVDVSGMGSGQTVKCPYTGKLFRVPSAQQAENKAVPRQESKVETPNLSSELKTGDKKP